MLARAGVDGHDAAMGQPRRRPTFPAIPTNEIPALAPFRLILAHTDKLALWLSNVRVYSTGITFSVEAGQREGDRFLGMHGFGKPEAGHTPPMLFGVEDSAGTISTNLPKSRSGLRPGGGGGSGSNHAAHYSLTPLPAPGPMSIFVAWPHFGIPETRFEVDAAAFHEAVSDVVIMWPTTAAEQIRVDIDNFEIPPVEIPAGGWFESVGDQQQPPPADPDAPRRVTFGSLG